jgi:hypothetical protein
MAACSVDAIHLVNQRAVIDAALCTHCEACIGACSNGAITAIPEPARQAQLIALQDAQKSNLPIPTPGTALDKVSAPRSLAPLTGAVLAFLGQEVAPRLVEVLMTALERRLTAPATRATASATVSPKRPARLNRGIRRQARVRGMRNNYWKF